MTQATILVVDDDSDIVTILKDNLALDGYGVVSARTGKAALKNFKRHSVDLMILDLMLPDMDGVQICRAIRSQSKIPIIMLTAKDQVSDKVLGLENGADDYVVKPFDYLELAARIKVCLRRNDARRHLSPATHLQTVGRLTQDPQAREVALDGTPIPLTKKEYDILEVLMQFPGQVLERERIRQAVWPDTKLYKWSRTIDVHIQHLRAKLEINPDLPQLIITVQGVGYMLAPTG